MSCKPEAESNLIICVSLIVNDDCINCIKHINTVGSDCQYRLSGMRKCISIIGNGKVYIDYRDWESVYRLSGMRKCISIIGNGKVYIDYQG